MNEHGYPDNDFLFPLGSQLLGDVRQPNDPIRASASLQVETMTTTTTSANDTTAATPNHTPPSLLFTLMEQQEQQAYEKSSPRQSRGILLVGPCQSGKTSLLMEAAIQALSSLSSSCACTKMDKSPSCVSRTPVILFKRQSSSSLLEHSHDDDDEPDDFPFFVRKQSTPATAMASSSSLPESSSMLQPQQDWDPALLQRIRIQYYTTYTDLLFSLWTLQGLPHMHRPCRAILIDDLQLASTTTTTTTTATSHSSQPNERMIHQILAVLRDTAHFLGSTVHTVVALSTETTGSDAATVPSAWKCQTALCQQYYTTFQLVIPRDPPPRTHNKKTGTVTHVVSSQGTVQAEIRLHEDPSVQPQQPQQCHSGTPIYEWTLREA